MTTDPIAKSFASFKMADLTGKHLSASDKENSDFLLAPLFCCFYVNRQARNF